MKTRPRSAVLLHHTTGSEVIGCLEPERSISSVTFDCSASSDDEVQSLVGAQDSPLPLEFRTSPPEGAHRPTRSLSPPPKFFLADCRQDLAAPSAAAAMSTPAQHAEPPAALSVANGNNIASPRKRHRHAHRSHHQIQRPCLDFEKMQQVSVVLFFCFFRTILAFGERREMMAVTSQAKQRFFVFLFITFRSKEKKMDVKTKKRNVTDVTLMQPI